MLKRLTHTACLVLLLFLSGYPAKAELIASDKDTHLVVLTPLRNGLSALTLVWPIEPGTQARAYTLSAALASVVSGGTSVRSSHEVQIYRSSKGIETDISAHGPNLMLTISAPSEVFPETIIQLENLLLQPEYSQGWFAREREKFNGAIATKTARPSHVLNETLMFMDYPTDQTGAGEGDPLYRFGHPSQAILRSGDKEVERRVSRLLGKLPKARRALGAAFSNLTALLTAPTQKAFELPTGTIHFEDPHSTEMLIFLVKAKEFADEREQIGANLLLDYIGANQGSEMFRIIRQELRAAYSPRSEFTPFRARGHSS
jgi:hypothetical protein